VLEFLKGVLIVYFKKSASLVSLVALLVGCNAGGSQLTPSGALAQNAARAHHSGSWMAPDAKKENLVYVSDGGGLTTSGNGVYVYSYPEGKLKGTLTGVDGPQGMCVDATGDVWVTNTDTTELTEFAHGGTAPIATLSDPGEFPDGCAVDPTTGNIAATSLCTSPNCGQGGDLAIYKKGTGTPTTYSDPSIRDFYFCSYDASGDLFLDGAGQTGSILAELPSGGNSLVNIKLDFITIDYPGGVQWDGKDLAIGDQVYAGSSAGVIYRVKVKGTIGKPVGETVLDDQSQPVNVGQFWIQGNRVVGPSYPTSAGIWKYPAGGAALKILPGEAPYGPIGSVVSLAE
jgi:hypothetical protein